MAKTKANGIVNNTVIPTANDGTWAWKNATTSVGNAGTHTFKAVFTPTK